MKILIIGSSGFLGQHLVKMFNNSKNTRLFHNGIKSKKFDLTKIINLEKIIVQTSPDILINCSGLTDLSLCEKNKKLSHKLNYEIVNNLFKIKKKKKINFKLIQLSTDQLYDNPKKIKSTENSKIYINNQYSRDKYKAEKIALKNKALVLRLNFIGHSSKKSGFLHWVKRSFLKKKRFYLFNDVYFNPISITSLKKIIIKIIFFMKKDKKIHGLFNLGSRDGMFKNDLATYFAKQINVFNDRFININVNELDKSLKKSKQMFMDVSKFEKKFNMKLPYLKKEILIESKEFLRNDYKNRKK